MAGIPPLFGFMGKLFLFNELIVSGNIFLACYVVLFSIIGIYYYLKVIRFIYFEEHGTVTVLPNVSVF